MSPLIGDLVIFDLDGTLIDSKLDLVHSVNAARGLMNLPPISEELVSSYVGNGAPVLMRRALGPEASEADVQRGLEFFLKYYRAHMLDNTRLYPGVKDALDRLRDAGAKMAVLTNKPVRFSRSIVEGLGLTEHFFQVYGGNSFEQKKPDPVGIETLLSESGVARERTIMVGDSGVDIQTARNANVQACGVSYGFQPESFVEYPPDLVVDDMAELAEIRARNLTLTLAEFGQAPQFRPGRAGVDGLGGALHRFAQIRGNARGDQSSRAVHQHDVALGVAMAARLSLQHCCCNGGVAGTVAAAQSFHAGRQDAEVSRSPLKGANLRARDLKDQSRSGGGDFVESVGAVDDEGALGTQPSQRSGHQLRRVRGRRADQLSRGAGGIGQRPQQIEYGAHLQLRASRLGMLHRGMQQRREKKSDADLANRLGHALGGQRHVNTQLFQNVGTAALAGKRAVAVLGDAHARTSHHERRDSGDVERGAAVAARAAGIEQRFGIQANVDSRGLFAHGSRESEQFFGSLALAAQAHRNAEMWGVVAWPVKMTSMASRASAAERSSRAAILCRNGKSMEGFASRYHELEGLPTMRLTAVMAGLSMIATLRAQEHPTPEAPPHQASAEASKPAESAAG